MFTVFCEYGWPDMHVGHTPIFTLNMSVRTCKVQYFFTRPKPLDFLRAKKILSTPSFRGEVKPSVPCRRFAACKRSLNVAWKSTFRQNYRTTFSPTVPTSAAGIYHAVADVEAPGGEKWGHLKSGGKQWQTTPKNLPRMQRTRVIPVA